MKKVLAVFVSAVFAVSAASALDFESFGGGIEKGDVLLSPGFGFGRAYDSAWDFAPLFAPLLGGTLAVDVALPVFALTVGVESGFLNYKFDEDWWGKVGMGIIPIMARVGYHPDLGVKNLDVYVLAKIGWAFGLWTGADKSDQKDDAENPKGLGFGLDIGVRYFFAKHIGVFAEGGWEYYFLKYDWKDGYGTGGAYAQKFGAAGVTFKL